MHGLKKPAGILAVVICIPAAAYAQTPDFSGAWSAKAACPVGPVEFTANIQGAQGTLDHEGLGPQKLYAAKFPIKLTYFPSDMQLHVAGLDQGADFGSFQGTLLADGTVSQVRGLKVNGQYCQPFTLARNQAKADPSAKAPSLDAQGLSNEQLFIKLLHGNFAAINVPTDHPVFNGLFGAYLNAYARQCAADPKTRPRDFVEMTNLQCVQEGITATYYRDGTYTESAPYCTRWEDVPSGLFAAPGMWKVKKKLDAVFLGDAYKHMFAYAKSMDPSNKLNSQLDSAFKPSAQKILAALATGSRDFEALVRMNGCDSPGLMRFQENLKLYALNQPFGIRPDGSLKPPVPIPAPGTDFVDPNYGTLLEDLIKGEARSWQVNKYVLNSIASPSVKSRDDLGRPLSLTANYKYNGMAGIQTGVMTVSFVEGYPACLYFSDRPDACRTPDKQVVARYIHGGYSPQSAPPPMSDEERQAQEQRRKEAKQARQNMRGTAR